MEDDDMETEATEFPIKTDHLVKGSVVAIETIERAFGVKRDARAYQLAMLKISSYIEQRFADRGELVFVVQEKGALRILTDEEAPGYGVKRFREGMRTAGRAHATLSGADRSQMSSDTLAQHDRALEVQGRMLVAAAKERRALPGDAPPPSKRQTPGRKRLSERK